jgi:hypothetical protein
MKVICIDNLGNIPFTVGKTYEVINDREDWIGFDIESDNGFLFYVGKDHFKKLEEEKEMNFVVRCVNVDDTKNLTLEKDYLVVKQKTNSDGTEYYTVKDDNGITQDYYKSRFEIITESNKRNAVAKCVDNSSGFYSTGIYLTVGKNYEIIKEKDDNGDEFCKVIDDRGNQWYYYKWRFELIDDTKKEENMPKKESIWWIVVNDAFPTRVTYKHTDFDKSCAEAQRLAKSNPGQKFVVCQAVKAFEVAGFVQTDYEHLEDEIPF